MESTTHIPHDHGSSDPQSEAQMAYSLERGHEQRDASIKAIVIFVIVLTVSVVVIQFAVWGLESLLKYQNNMEDPQKVSSVSQPLGRRTPPPEPRLQPSPAHPTVDHDDWLTLLERWNRQLNSYGKVEGDPTRSRYGNGGEERHPGDEAGPGHRAAARQYARLIRRGNRCSCCDGQWCFSA